MKVYWYYRQRNQSPLVTAAYLARQKRLLLPGQYALEHENTIMDGADAFTTATNVEAAMGTGWTEQQTGRPGLLYEHFWDLGAVHDPTVGGCGHSENGVIAIDALLTFQGSQESPVKFAVVKHAMLDLAQRFPAKRIRVESWQGLSLTQELRSLGLPVEIFTPTAKAHNDEWPVLAQRLSSRTLVLFPHDRLREELLNLTYEVAPGGGVRVIDKGKVHQDHAVVVRGICAGLHGPRLGPPNFYCDGRWLIEDSPEAIPTPTVTPHAPGVMQVSPTSDAEDYARMKSIRQKSLLARTSEEHAWLQAYSKRVAEQREQEMNPILRDAMGDGYLPKSDALADIAARYRRWKR